MEAGGGESTVAAESHVQMPDEMEDVSGGDVRKDGLSYVGKLYHSRRICSDDETDSHSRDGDEISSGYTTVPEQRLHKKKKQIKHWDLVSSSDAEADTLKDRFWRNLEEGVLPEDLVTDDLYSSVCK